MSEQIQEAEPDVWMQHMRRGKFEEAWKKSDADLKARAGQPCWHLPRHFQYIWDGSSLVGKRVLVRCYHGLGDTVQFIRYMPLLKEIAAKVIVWAQAPLIPLLKTVSGIDQLLPLHDGTPEVDYDADIEIMELPHYFRTTLATLPAQVPYLHAEPLVLTSDNSRLKVGLVWKAGDWDESRSIPFSSLTPLAELPSLQFYMLQANAPEAGWNGKFGEFPGNFSLYDYARVVKDLDLLITVDSMPAHLAGAMGIPVWTLLRTEADWRWMDDRDDSPWYPTMHLFRQTQSGNWDKVISRVAEELSKLSRDKD
ncbi:ADP-heptose--LPS heptosyltransferase [Adhaeribacter swui]|uniref:ADP-heptose--LPS heptosyltransferase n=1 Tax=Adhaeribacter swui TaxID=2086471 RepID=A0A7G7G3W0_9BACT|nr:ADP-heptose--LPS heptosyltransferase [Adhaeribacter swui]QNF31844.1 ADP-heptose--LPS heptosyltransferase [Adhaeribacter swui]